MDMTTILYKVMVFFILIIPVNKLAIAQTNAVTEIKNKVVPMQGKGFDSIFLADPTIFYHKQLYYLYGTGGDVGKGFLVYVSSDLKTWKGPMGKTDGYALVEGDSYGTTGFWAPQVFEYQHKFYMAYTANENIAIAESDSPLGPFKQQTTKPVSGTGKQIDPFVFMDTDGKKYLFHVRLTEGNRLFVTEMKSDLSDIKPETLRECLHGKDSWENTAQAKWPVTEGPTVLKHQGLYYLFYSANDFRNINYAVGYATAKSPYGPWIRYDKNPIISRHNMHRNGTGHGDFLKGKNGNWFYVFHAHRSDKAVSPRVTAIVQSRFVKDKGTYTHNMIIRENSLYYPVVKADK